MKKWVFLALVLIVSTTRTTAFANNVIFETVNYNIKIGNSDAKLHYPIYVSDNRVYVSIRSICDNLSIPVLWDDEKKEVKMDIYNKKIQVSDKTSFKEEGVIPDVETALVVGKAILKKYVEKPLEYEAEDKIYYLEVEYLEQQNAWKICQTFRYKDENKGWSAGGKLYRPYVVISKQTAEVLFINTHSSF